MKYPKDRFDDFPTKLKRRGAHRAPRSRASKLGSWLIAIASFVLLVGIGVGAMWMIDRQVQFTSQAGQEEETETPEPTETGEPEPEPTPTEPVATFDDSVPVSVLNGAGIGGLAGAASDALEAAGWNITEVGDADSSDEVETVVAAGSDAELPAALAVVEELGVGAAEVDASLAQPGEIVVIVGSDAEFLVFG